MNKGKRILATTVILASQLILPTTNLATTKIESSEKSQEIQSQEPIKNSESSISSSEGIPDKFQNQNETSQVKTENVTTNSNETVKQTNESTNENPIDDWMPDKNLQNIIKEILNKDDFTQEDLLSITEVSVDNVDIKDVKGLSFAKNLISLTVTNSDLSTTANMSEIGTLSKLETVIATNDNFKDLSFLTDPQLSSLKYVDISRNNLSDLNSLKGANFPSMENFNISQNNLSDISILENVTVPKLRILDASSNKISDITPIKNSKITSIEQLNVSNNLIEDTSAFKDSTLTNLTTMDVSYNKIKDISVMKGLQSRYPNLQSFNASGNQIADITFMNGYDLKSSTRAESQIYLQDITVIKSLDPDKLYYDVPVPIKSVKFDSNPGTDTYKISPDDESTFLSLSPQMESDKFFVNYYDGQFGSFWDGTAPKSEGIKSFAVIAPQNNLNTTKLHFYWNGASSVFNGNGTLNIHWIDAQAPVIEAKDQAIQVGDTFDPTKNITAYDQQKDGSDKVNLTNDIKVLENNVDTKKAGVYAVKYSVTNSYGVTTEKSITVTVTDKKVDTVKVTFNAGKGGSLQGTTTMDVPKGSKVTDLPKTVANKSNVEDIYFLDWYQNGKVVNPKAVTINNDTTFTAKFGAAVYRLYNKNNGDHLLTKNKDEKNKIAAKGWKVETNPKNEYGRAAFYVPVQADSAGKKQVYRIYNPNSGEHFYTTNKSEADAAVKKGWRHETDSNYTWVSEGDVKIYREFNPDSHTAGSHNFTTDLKEHKNVVKAGWRDESKDSSLWTVLKAGF